MNGPPSRSFDPPDDFPMKGYEREDSGVLPETKSAAKSILVPGLLFVLLLAGVIGLGFYSRRLSVRLAEVESALQAQSAQVGRQQESIQGLQNQAARGEQHFSEIRSELALTNDHLGTTQGEIRRTRQVADRLVKQQQDSSRQLTRQLGQLQREQSDAKGTIGALSANVNTVRQDVGGVRREVGATKEEVATTRSDLQRVTEGLGFQNGLIARNQEELAELRLRGERDYFEFDLRKVRQPQRFGSVALLLKRTDVKRQKYTIDLTADDRRIEKKDRNSNEPVLFYQSGHRIPSEIVVNQVYKDRIVGYVSVPKRGVTRPTSQASSLRNGP